MAVREEHCVIHRPGETQVGSKAGWRPWNMRVSLSFTKWMCWYCVRMTEDTCATVYREASGDCGFGYRFWNCQVSYKSLAAEWSGPHWWSWFSSSLNVCTNKQRNKQTRKAVTLLLVPAVHCTYMCVEGMGPFSQKSRAFQEVHNTEQPPQDGTPEVRGLHHIKVTLSFENEKVFFQRQSPSIFFSPSTDSSRPKKTL